MVAAVVACRSRSAAACTFATPRATPRANARPSPPPAQGGGAISGTISDGAGPPPTLAALVSGVAPDPTKAAPATAFLAKVLQVDPTAPLTPDQVARAQRIMTNLLKPSGFAGRINVPPDPAVAASRAIAAPVGTPQPAATADIAARETAAYGGPQRNLTQAEATAIATGNAPGTGGAAGAPFGLPPAAEAVWQRMAPSPGSAESSGQQFNRDGSVRTSPKGAIGIAQVEPGTLPEAARLAGLPPSLDRLKNDPNYNLAVGRAYFAKQVQTFGSPDAAAAAYNAGPQAVVSAMAKANSRGGSYLDYLPAETRDYVAKVTTGGAPQAAGGGGGQAAPAQANWPKGPPLPAGANGDPQRAILMIRQEAGLRRDRGGPGQAGELDQWADAIAKSTGLMEVSPGQRFVDPRTGQTVLQSAPNNLQQAAAERFLAENPNATAEQIQQFQLTGRGARSGIAMFLAKYQQEHPDATDEDIKKAAQDYQAEGTALTRFGSGAQGNAIKSFNVLVDHAGTMDSAIDALKNGNIPLFNRAAQEWARQTGNPAPTNFDATKAVFGDEIIKAVIGAGGALGDREEAKAALDKANSPAQLAGVVNQYRKLALGQLRGLSFQYQAATGRDDFDRLLAPGTKKFFEEGGKDEGAPAQSAPGAAGQPVKVTTEDEYNALPKGTTYIHPDGTTRTKQ